MKRFDLSRHGPIIVATAIRKVAWDLHMGKISTAACSAKIIAMRLGPPPAGFSNWTLRLLAEQVIALEVVETISYETVRRTLKKTG